MNPAGAWLAPNFRFPAAIAAGDVLDGVGRRREARARYAEAVRDAPAPAPRRSRRPER